jgi:hypothetical protein
LNFRLDEVTKMAFHYETSYSLARIEELKDHIQTITFMEDSFNCLSIQKIVHDLYDISLGFEFDCLKECPTYEPKIIGLTKKVVIDQFKRLLIDNKAYILEILQTINKYVLSMEEAKFRQLMIAIDA